MLTKLTNTLQKLNSINRTQKSINEYSNYKESDLQNFLFNIGIGCLKDFLPKKYCEIFFISVISMRTLISDLICGIDNEDAEAMIDYFFQI